MFIHLCPLEVIFLGRCRCHLVYCYSLGFIHYRHMKQRHFHSFCIVRSNILYVSVKYSINLLVISSWCLKLQLCSFFPSKILLIFLTCLIIYMFLYSLCKIKVRQCVLNLFLFVFSLFCFLACDLIIVLFPIELYYVHKFK